MDMGCARTTNPPAAATAQAMKQSNKDSRLLVQTWRLVK